MNKGKFFIFLIIAIVCVAGLVYLYNTINRSEGYRGGSIVKLSKKGILFKTWEGQFYVGNGMVVGEDNVSLNNNVWEFSVQDNDTLIQKLKYYVGKGTRVSLLYHQKYTKLPWRGDTDYIVVGIEEIKK